MTEKNTKVPQYWLMKSEPACYSIDDLKRDRVEPWDGTRNYQVRNMMRDDMQVGDLVLFYHSNTKEIGVVGTMKVTSKAYPDPTQFDPKSEHPDPKSDPLNPRWLCVDVKFQSKFSRTVSLAEIKINPMFETMPLVKKGNRLSVMPVNKRHFTEIVKMAGE
ncbi:MAG: putative RNA-binding protein with PUA-like domain [Acidimicrobiales bacterium]|jgi:predicted RNA-binding protein with PUA-like domain